MHRQFTHKFIIDWKNGQHSAQSSKLRVRQGDEVRGNVNSKVPSTATTLCAMPIHYKPVAAQTILASTATSQDTVHSQRIFRPR